MSTDKLVSKSDLQDFYNRILPYLGGSADAGFTPVGTVISVMGKTAPANYLACNGQIVNIADYPELATYFEQQFGSKNYFGGDGTTTFGIVDLSGEFLRGTGTNSHTNQGSGASVGVHQDGTLHLDVHIGSDGKIIYSGRINNTNTGATQIDYQSAQVNLRGSCASSSVSTATSNPYYTSRPTNTSVLFCIATKNIYLNPSLDFSTSEKVVGTWIDGSTIYQKTAQVTLPAITDGTFGQVEWNIESLNVNEIISLKYLARQSANGQWTDGFYMAGDGHIVKALHVNDVLNNNYAIRILSNSSSYSNGKCYITIQYTKTSD